MNAEQNNTVSLPQLIQLITELSGVDAAESRKFLHEFFALIEETLVQGHSVKIKGIGCFAVEDRDSGTVRFTPDAELAAAINTPFAMFEAIELGDGISPEDLTEEEADGDNNDATPAKEEYILAIDTEDIETEGGENKGITLQETEEADTEAIAESEEPEIADTEEACEEYHPQQYDVEPEPPRCSIKGYLAVAIIALVAGFLAGYHTHRSVYGHKCIEVQNTPVNIVESDKAVHSDSVAAVESIEPDVEQNHIETVRDTVRSNNFLASMARRHYGHMEYWVYIYNANPGLGHPDRIKPGTVVTIPAESDFAQGSDSATIAHALRLYADIYSRYK